jgi:pyruvate,orthophosphate dikinase
VVTEQGGSTSQAAVVSRALGRPCVVGCGTGALTDLAGRVVTLDGQSGRVFSGRLPVEEPNEVDDGYLVELIRWCEARAPLPPVVSEDVVEIC